MNILIVDDKAANLDAGKELLSDKRVSRLFGKRWFNVDIIHTFHGAIDMIRNWSYDVVLTDLNMPIEQSDQYNKRPPNYGSLQSVPYWYQIASVAIEAKVPYIAIVTDANYHSDALAAWNTQIDAVWLSPTLRRSWYIIENWPKWPSDVGDYKPLSQLQYRLKDIIGNRERRWKPLVTETHLLLKYTYVNALKRLFQER